MTLAEVGTMTPIHTAADFPWKALVEASPDGILAFDRECRYTVWNAAMERIAGVPAGEVLGRVAWEVFPFLKEEGEDAFFSAALRGEVQETADRVFRIPQSGREGFFRGEYGPLHDGAGQVIGGMAVIRDTTESRRAAEALRLHTQVLESMTEGVSVADENGFIVYTNAAEDRMFGYERGELVGRHVTVQNAYPPEENERIVAEVIEHLKTSGEWVGEWSNVRKDGAPFLTRSRITALELGGRPHWVCVQEDITRERLAQAETENLHRTVQESSALLDTLFQTAPVALAFVDRGLRYRRVNDSLAEIDRSTPGEMIGRTVREVIPRLADAVEPLYRRVIERGEPVRGLEVSGPRPGAPGETGHWLTNYTPVRAADGEILGVGMAALDITERKRGEEAQRFLADASAVLAGSLELEETLGRLARMVVDRIADGCAIDMPGADGRLERVCVLSRDPRKQAIVETLERRYPADRDSAAGHTTAFRTGEPQLYPALPDELLRAASVDDEHFRLWKELEMQAVINAPLLARGRTLGVITLVSHTAGRGFDEADLALAVDLASRAALAIDNARLYAESLQANRAKTEFLAAMSHELRTPLNAIAGYVDLIDAGIHGPVTDPQRFALHRVKRSQEYLLRLINDVLHFAQLEAGRLEFSIAEVAVGELLEEITSVVEPQAQARGIACGCHPTDPGYAARADADRVRQIVLNLVGNSLKFTPPGGWVAVRCDADDERVYVRVQDNGRGIPASRLESIFDPFVQVERNRYETSQQGVGLGLAISRDLARGMGGDLLAESEEGAGSTFTLALPRVR